MYGRIVKSERILTKLRVLEYEYICDTHTHTTVLLLFCNLSRTTRVSRYQKGKTRKVKANLDLLEQEIVSGSGICWAICKSAPHICDRTAKFHKKILFITRVINIQILTTKYFSFQYSVTYCSQALRRKQVTWDSASVNSWNTRLHHSSSVAT